MDNFYINSVKFGLSFYKKAISKYKVHSPFFYSLIEDVFDQKKQHYCFPSIEHLRKKLLKDTRTIKMLDFGAGSRLHNSKTRLIKEIAKTSLSPKYQCKSMFWLVNRFQPRNIIELGSSLGISTLYLALASKKSNIISFEGNPDSINIAANQASFLNIKNIEFIEGNFNKTLPEKLKNVDHVDMAFIDGNHQYEATITYFDLLLPKINENSVLIFDDIHWSKGMKRAWEQIKSHSKVKASIDLYDYGIIFFNSDFLEEKHIELIPVYLKPWQYINL